MSKGFLTAFGIGLVVVALVIGGVFYGRKGAHLAPTGSVLKARSQELDPQRSLLLLDLRLKNDSDVLMLVRTVEMSIETADGKEMEGVLMAASDMDQLFHYYPLLGEKFNPPLVARDKVPPRGTADRMLAARFDLPVAELERRKKVNVRVEDADCPVAVITGK